MKKFVVGYLSFFENNIELKVVHAENEVLAVRQILEFHGQDVDRYALGSMESINDYCSNCDLTISVIEI